jgi:hypothetical protein
MTFPRKTAAVLAFAVAFALAIALTTFLQMRLRGNAPNVQPTPQVEPTANISREDSPIAFRVEQAVVDFAKQAKLHDAQHRTACGRACAGARVGLDNLLRIASRAARRAAGA